MATEYQLYHQPLSQPSRSVLLILKVINAPHKVNIVDLSKGDQTKPEFLKLNPKHAVPVIVHGDFSLTESVAIAKYIINTHKSDDHWYPADLKKRARVDEFLAYHHTTIRSAGVNICMKFVFIPKRTGKPTPAEEKEAALKKFSDALETFEGYFLKNGPFIAGDEVSIADIFAISEIVQTDMSGHDCISSHKKTKEWVERTKAALQPHFDEVFGRLTEFVKEVNQK